MDPADDTKIIFTENNVIYYLAGGERKKKEMLIQPPTKAAQKTCVRGQQALNNKRFNLVWGTTPPQGANHIERE